MRTNAWLAVVTMVLAIAASIPAPADDAAPMGTAAPSAKNVILMIADGCGYNHVDAVSHVSLRAGGQDGRGRVSGAAGSEHVSGGRRV